MATIKAYSDFQQSKKLAEILPLESADMGLYYSRDPQAARNQMLVGTKAENAEIPCWSLAALLEVLPSATLDSSDDHHYRLYCNKKFTEWHDNAIDACYEMIIKLHEFKML